MLLAKNKGVTFYMYKRNSKLTKVEISHNLDREIFYEDTFTLEEMLQIIFETMWNYESPTGVLSKRHKEK